MLRDLIIYIPFLFIIAVTIFIRVYTVLKKKKSEKSGIQIPEEKQALPRLPGLIFPTVEPESEEPKSVRESESILSPYLQQDQQNNGKPAGIDHLKKIESLSPLKRAIVWLEILGPPGGLIKEK